MSFKRFTFFNSIVIFIWMIIVVVLGWLAGKGVNIILATYKNLQLGILILLITLVLFYIIRVNLIEKYD